MARILLVVTLVLFGALTSVAVWHHGYRGIFETMFQSWAGVQVLVDLVIALVLVLVWMWRDAQVLKRSVWPYVLTRKTPGNAT